MVLGELEVAVAILEAAQQETPTMRCAGAPAWCRLQQETATW
jgi:hypothetical protein